MPDNQKIIYLFLGAVLALLLVAFFAEYAVAPGKVGELERAFLEKIDSGNRESSDVSTAEESTPTLVETVSRQSDEGIFEIAVNPTTASECVGFDREAYICVRFPDETTTRATKESIVRISDISGFSYDRAYSYVLKVERVRSNQYGALDGRDYDYTLLEVISQEAL
jgi:hypothetical protein